MIAFYGKDIHGLLYANVILVGGNANIPGYMDRM